MKIGENTEFKLELKTIISIIVLTSTFMGMYYTLQGDIEEAKTLPPAQIERLEYDLKREWMETHIINLEKEVKDLKQELKQVEKQLHHGNEKKR